MALDQEAKKREAEAKQRLVAEAKKSIEAIINKIPSDHSRWSYQRAVAFKAAVDKARQILKSERATVNSAQMAASELQGYHK